MKILIIGSEGFIGSHLVQYYRNKKWQVHGADLYEVGTQAYYYHKISRLSPEYNEILQQTKFDICINAAGSGAVPYSVSHPVSDFEANALDTIRILDGLRTFQPQCKYLHISSAAVYGNPARIPVKETHETKPISPYGWHKLIAEKICCEYQSVFKLRTVAVRPFSVFGPGLKKQLFWDLFQKCRETKNNKIELWGNGNESRDFIFVDDLMRAFDAVIQNAKFEGEVINIGAGVETTVEQAAKNFIRRLNPEIEIIFSQQGRVGDPQNWCADIFKLLELGFSPQVTFEQGVEKLVLWMKSLS